MPLLHSIQVLRALAASAVVLHHAQLNVALGFGRPALLPDLAVASAGVDVFFVVSGFIMTTCSWSLFGKGGAPATFLLRRIARVVPLYWAVTTLYVLAARLLPPDPARAYPLPLVVASYLFVPWPRPDGTVQPVHVVGWTLNYEMMFYALFAAALLLSRPIGLAAVPAGLLALVAVGLAVQPETVLLAFWSEPIVLEFAAGLALGAMHRTGRRLPLSLALLALGTAAMLLLLRFGLPIPAGLDRLSAFGLPACLLVAGAALGRFPAIWRVPRPVLAIGDASYSLYLLHPVALFVLRILAGRLGVTLDTSSAAWLYAAVSLVASAAIAVVAFRWFEVPVTRVVSLRTRHPAPTVSTGDSDRHDRATGR